MKHLTLILLAFTALQIIAAPTNKPKTVPKVDTTGGMVVQPNSSKGFIAVVNEQQKVDIAAFKSLVQKLDSTIRFDFRFVTDTDAAKGAAITIRLVDDPKRPSLLIAPEDHWAEINMARLVDDLKLEASKEKFLPLRARKMFLRAYAYVSGAGGSAFQGNLLDTTSLRDLDYREEFIPVDAVDNIARHLRKLGLKHANITTYAEACEEGWAPKPTNSVQKAIWDEVHALPTNPIKIVPPNQKK